MPVPMSNAAALAQPREPRASRHLMGLAGLLLVQVASAPPYAPVSAETRPSARAVLDATAARRLLDGYRDHLAAIDGNDLVWRDGSRMPLDDGRGVKPFDDWLAAPDIEDMFHLPYPAAGSAAIAPPPQADPGRARHAAFFDKVYGDCRNGGVKGDLVDVVWLPRKYGKRLQVTRINGVAARLAAVSRELDALPSAFDKFLLPPAGTFNCRGIAGTDRVSAHGHAIAIDLATAHSDYWRWSRADASGRPVWRNRIPLEIVAVFEKHGFIWGGRWHHYDTMHFEYRPELLPPTTPLP
ncbi:MAG: M15 family metallopeptidase [Hyphomicrobiaceae bacterium]